MEKLIITPKTKIYDLLEAYPELEEVLIRLAPEFKKLRNPILRKTIARMASIAQAATVGGLQVEQLVNELRNTVGQSRIEQLEDEGGKYVRARPEWFKEDALAESIDIREMLNRGEQPVHEVLSRVKALEKGTILEVVAPFVPAPLIDKSLSLNCQHWVNQIGEGDVRVYFMISENENI